MIDNNIISTPAERARQLADLLPTIGTRVAVYKEGRDGSLCLRGVGVVSLVDPTDVEDPIGVRFDGELPTEPPTSWAVSNFRVLPADAES